MGSVQNEMVELYRLWHVDQEKPECPFWSISSYNKVRCLDHLHILFILITHGNMRGCDGDSSDKTPVQNSLNVLKTFLGNLC